MYERPALALRARAIELGPAVVVTHDPADMKKLAAAFRDVRVVAI